MGAIPLPPKATVEEHTATQSQFLADHMGPRLAEARAGTRTVLFVDAAHFVPGSFLCCMWYLVRMFVRAASGRRRYNMRGAWDAVTRQLIRVCNDTMVELLARIAAQVTGPVTLVLDNARYQRCAAVRAEAARLSIDLLFLPSYSPNLNLIERLWKFTKKNALRGKHYPDFASFRAAIDDCLDRLPTAHKDELHSLMTLKFQTFDKASSLAA